jgi:diguanylate cyclase
LTSLQHWYRALLVRTSPEADLAKLCQILVEDAGYRLAWFGQVRANGKPKVKPMTGAGLGQADLDELEFSRQTAKTSQTLIETAIRTGQPAVARNIFTDAEHKRWRAEAAKLGYASFVLFPVPGKEPESSSGILMIYAAEADAFITEEMELLKQLVSDLPHPNLGLENKKGQ